MSAGTLSFVLHAHIPYVRKAGVWPFGEEWLFEVMASSYIPVLRALEALPKPRKPLLTLSLTPVLVEQLCDGYMKQRFEQYLYHRIDLCAKDVDRHRDRPERRALAQMYEARYHSTLVDFRDRMGRDLVGEFRKLEEEGRVELMTSAATHAYLPLLGTESAIRAQIRAGTEAHRRAFGKKPEGIWLPECGYRPAGTWREPGSGREVQRPGLESFLAEEGIRYFIVDHHTIEGGRAGGVYWERFPFLARPRGPDGSVERAPSGRSTFRPYIVGSGGTPVAVLGRNERTGLQVWSADWGYPGDGWYREFHKRDSVSGLQYWRVTDRQSRDLGTKLLYEPDKVGPRLEDHSAHFAGLAASLLKEHAGEGAPVIVAPYDLELFGHWWYEGVRWLTMVLERLPAAGVEPLSCGAYLSEHPPSEEISLPESSWGAGGDHRVWLNPDTEWMWREIHQAERWMEEAARRHSGDPSKRELLAQAARELMLLEASDWEFLVSTFQAREYAVERFKGHLERFAALRAAVEDRGQADLDRLRDMDNIFPWLEPGLYI
ncbi:MAG: 1,4-alpha-glucan branching protein domain-containing protein [Thermoplasmata archaeon]